MVGLETGDDAGVILINDDQAIVQTVDFFSPIVDDCYLFGQIAAANSLSDVYAMGAKPLTALNIACFPECLTPAEMGAIMRGGADKLIEAGVILLGGHTVENPEPKFGMAVTGIIKPEDIWTNTGAEVGDVLLLTKAIGTGVLGTAIKAGKLSAAEETTAIQSMCSLNKLAAETLREHATVHACTDITGFGLLGHLAEMVQTDPVSFTIAADALPFLPGALAMAEQGLIPGGAYRNQEYYGEHIVFADDVPQVYQDLMFDPQTSGGLVAAIPAAEAERVIAALQAKGVLALVIGSVDPQKSATRLHVTFGV